jgi:hypothetical protein
MNRNGLSSRTVTAIGSPYILLTPPARSSW